jgi:hypothetical protein
MKEEEKEQQAFLDKAKFQTFTIAMQYGFRFGHSIPAQGSL